MKPLKIAAAETGIDHQQVRELFAELVALDTAYMRELRLDLQAALDFYYDSVKRSCLEYTPHLEAACFLPLTEQRWQAAEHSAE
jgi:hypothetical protein